MIVGVPLFAVIYDVLKQAVSYGLKKRGQEELLDAYHAATKQSDAQKKKPSIRQRITTLLQAKSKK